ncbi:hypothetical protein [Photobacterium sp. TY1-4]|uniref:hypothetical protein n=1 Tax=Photobacterium sp. TY1-4 TaxID=2899122 RepID=UPI0021C11ACF|nr:hypothetical protein [Photobacterium sp. TY1-4]UXI03716.1 hypothetical protein NH461_25215 [Photobacterium sp. TY1-4]
MKISPNRLSLLSLLPLLLTGCSTTTSFFSGGSEYSFRDSAESFIQMNDTRSNGAEVDKGLFYPKSAFSFTYRYCASSPTAAQQDMAEFNELAKRVCDVNKGQIIHQDTGSWCVNYPDTANEQPIFYARISSTELWADLCLDGPFVTLKVIENTEAAPNEWHQAAKVLGYQPYSQYRQLLPAPTTGQLLQPEKEPIATEFWNEESQYIYTNVGSVVCLYNRPEGENVGYTYRGTVHSVNNGLVKVAATTKLKGDIRTAPALEPMEWHHPMAYITAAANAWFVCG